MHLQKKTVMMFITLKKKKSTRHQAEREILNITAGLRHVILFLISTKKIFT